MTEAILRVAIENALGAVPYEPPVSHEYCSAVYAALRVSLPNAKLEVFHRGIGSKVELVAEAREGTTYYAMVVPLV